MLLRVHRVGILIEGAAGCGKSELALALLARGHPLVADDAVELRAVKGRLIGRCPARLYGFLEVRGLGILDVRRLYGPRACTRQTRIDLRLQLKPQVTPMDRLRGNYRPSRLLGVSLPCLSLPATLGHNLAVFTEAACLDLRLRQSGHDAVAALERRR